MLNKQIKYYKKNLILIVQSKRSMFTLRTLGRAIKPTQAYNFDSISDCPKRSFANQFSVIKLHEDSTRTDGKPVDVKHAHFIHNETKIWAGMATSTKTAPNGTAHHKISNVKMNGKFVPQKDTKTGEIILGPDGLPIPSETKGVQYITIPADKVKIKVSAIKEILVEKQQFADDCEPEILKAMEKNPTFKKEEIVILTKK